MAQQIRPVFSFDLNSKIVAGRVTIGKYDGSHPCLTVATIADKVLIHSPHKRAMLPTGRIIWSESNKEIALLNMNQTITALHADKLLLNDEKDILVIGSATHLLVYHVHDNRDVFYKECPDGVKAVTIGKPMQSTVPLVFVGGNSAIHAYDQNGNEVFWTAVGDCITDIIFADYNNDGSREMIVSSEDFIIRLYKHDKLVSEQTETEMVTGLAVLPDNRYAYSVSNGTIGVYEQDTRLWRVKSKNFAISMFSYDLMGLAHNQLITGWSNGKIDCRSATTGEVLFKDNLGHGVAGIVEADYRGIGKVDLICVSVEGEVRGYCTTKLLVSTVPGSNPEQDTVRELLMHKQALLLELKHYENNTKFNNESPSTRSIENVGVIPANTRLQISVATNESGKLHVEIAVSTNNDTIIRAVMIFAEGIFKGETLVVHPPDAKLMNYLLVALYPPKDNPVDIHIKALVGYKASKQYHVFELTRQLPRFAMYTLQPTDCASPQSSYVQFRVAERVQRICMWLNQNFLLDNNVEPTGEPQFRVNLRSLRDGACVSLVIDVAGTMWVYTGCMALAADLVRSLATFLNLEHLQSIAVFPDEESKLRQLMASLTDIQEARLRLGADVADKLGQIRGLIIKAEDSRINALKEMSKYYLELNQLNKELINGYSIRLQNYNEGLDAMKTINSIIQKSSRLRVGKYSSNLITHCRTAIRGNNVEGLIKIIRTGDL